MGEPCHVPWCNKLVDLGQQAVTVSTERVPGMGDVSQARFCGWEHVVWYFGDAGLYWHEEVGRLTTALEEARSTVPESRIDEHDGGDHA